MLLQELLKKENNNIDLLRLIAALAVIYGHAFAITPQPPLVDFVGARIVGEYSGSVAVKFFFFLSGLVVTNSLIRNPSIFNFVGARAARLLPGLAVCILVTTFVIAPHFSTLAFSDYLRDRLPYSYAWLGMTFRPEWALPGVFAGNPLSAVNGSLWTLPSEANCYIALAALAALGALRWTWVATTATLGIIVVLTLIYLGVIHGLYVEKHETTLLQIYFFSGVTLCLVSPYVEISKWTVGGLLAVAYLLKSTVVYPTLLVSTLLVLGLWLSTTRAVRKIRLPGDYSYGVYLYGFFIQQCIKAAFPSLDLRWHQIICMFIALACGAVSWHFIERPVMQFWKQRSVFFGKFRR